MRFEDVVSMIRMRTAQVAVRLPDGDTAAVGTGFLVGTGRYLVTANHVAQALGDPSALLAGMPGVDIDTPDLQLHSAFAHVPMKFLGADPKNDIAAFEVLMSTGAATMEFAMRDDDGKLWTSGQTGPVTFSSAPVASGLEIAISGFPLNSASLVTTRGYIASSWVSETRPADVVSYLGDITAISGNSGGPVYRVSDGRVIGVCVAVKSHNVDTSKYTLPLTVITPIEHVLTLLKDLGIDPGEVVLGVTPPARAKRGRK